MARPRRMGVFNALDELLPGPASERPKLEAVAAPARRRRPASGTGGDWDQEPRQELAEDRERQPAFNALDELLPGPLSARSRLLQLVSDPLQRRSGARSKHLSAYNPLDDLAPEPPPPKARVNLRVSADLLEAARDASAFLSESHSRVTLGDLAEDALRAELQRLAAEHNAGRPFPARDDEPKGRRTRR